MQEYTIIFKQGLTHGLRSNERTSKGVQTLIEALGLVPENDVMRSLDDLSETDLGLDVSWPFPQAFELKGMTVVCSRSALYEYVDDSLTALITGLAEGTTWSFADFWPYVVATNGRVLVVRDPQTGEWAEYEGCELPYCLCVENLNGQLVIGAPETRVTTDV